jgi:protein-S-isoprenylcysteine O-methyltransferase Ste14
MAMSVVGVTLIVVGTGAFFGLAILGWGGLGAFFSHPAPTALAVAALAMSGEALFAGGNMSPGEHEDRANRWVIIAFTLIGLLDAYLPAYTDRKAFWTIDGDTIRWLGVVLFAAGGALRIWPVFVLGRRFSGLVAIQPGHTLVTSGIYGVIRNPSYLGLLVNSLGWAMTFRSGVGVLLTALLMAPLLARTVRKRGCCACTLATSTMSTAPGHHGWFPDSIRGSSEFTIFLNRPAHSN